MRFNCVMSRFQAWATESVVLTSYEQILLLEQVPASRGANPSFFRGGVLSAGPNFSTKDRLGECNSANYTSPQINGINSEHA